MIRRLILCLCVLGAALAAPVNTASAAKKAAPKARTTAKKTATSKSAPKATTSAATPDAAPARTVAAPRRLEDIHIEGEIPAPQVLFVTARDQRRFTRFHHHRYLKTSVQVGETTLLPNRVALTSPPTTPAGQP